MKDGLLRTVRPFLYIRYGEFMPGKGKEKSYT